jgi:hypothetical protein
MKSCRPIWLVWLALAGLAPAAAAPAQGESVPVRLVAPRAGAMLLAGSGADLEWAPLDPSARMAGIEEWEAFLSFDGGTTYPVRITPHLDQDLRRVRWHVPGLPTSEAHLLLRFGDERREVYFELPQRFSIVVTPEAKWLFPLAGVATTPGEPALPGHAGVVAWVEGSRRGGSLRQVVAPDRPGLRPVFQPLEGHSEAAVVDSEDALGQSPAAALRRRGGVSHSGRRDPLAGLAPAPLPSSDILLLTHRQNE